MMLQRRARRAGLVVSQMSELNKERVNLSNSLCVVIWPGIGEPLVSIGSKDRDSCDSSGSVWSLKVETCLLFCLCGIA